jgi:hypothetical protein
MLLAVGSAALAVGLQAHLEAFNMRQMLSINTGRSGD